LVRPAVVSGALVAVVIGAGFAVGGHWLAFGLWMLLGTVLSLGNAAMVLSTVTALTAEENPRKRPLVLNTAVRLAIFTVIALVIAFLFRPAGLGVVFGLALTQVVLVLHTVIPVMKGLRQSS
jgi:hypothetical protein